MSLNHQDLPQIASMQILRCAVRAAAENSNETAEDAL